MAKKKRIKVRRTWNINPKEQIIPNRKKDNILKGQKISEEDFYLDETISQDQREVDDCDEFERGIK